VDPLVVVTPLVVLVAFVDVVDDAVVVVVVPSAVVVVAPEVAVVVACDVVVVLPTVVDVVLLVVEVVVVAADTTPVTPTTAPMANTAGNTQVSHRAMTYPPLSSGHRGGVTPSATAQTTHFVRRPSGIAASSHEPQTLSSAGVSGNPTCRIRAHARTVVERLSWSRSRAFEMGTRLGRGTLTALLETRGLGPMSYAVVLSDRPQDAAGVLLMVEDKDEAEQIAIEVRRAGHRVEVRRVGELVAEWKGYSSIVESQS
jgi:hypothetical protein